MHHHDIPAPQPLTFFTAFGRAFLRRCPLCGGKKIFRQWLRIVDNCPTCGLKFERIEGHWIGSIGVNSVLTGFTIIMVLIVAFILTYDDPSIPFLLSITIAVAVLAPLVYLPYTRTTWLAFDLLMRPLTPDDEVDPRYIPPARQSF